MKPEGQLPAPPTLYTILHLAPPKLVVIIVRPLIALPKKETELTENHSYVKNTNHRVKSAVPEKFDDPFVSHLNWYSAFHYRYQPWFFMH